MTIIAARNLYLTASNADLISRNGIQESFSKDLRSLIREVDFSIDNYESTLHISGLPKRTSKIGSILSTSPYTMSIVRETEFNGVALADNHIRDLETEGIKTAQLNEIKSIRAQKQEKHHKSPHQVRSTY